MLKNFGLCESHRGVIINGLVGPRQTLLVGEPPDALPHGPFSHNRVWMLVGVEMCLAYLLACSAFLCRGGGLVAQFWQEEINQYLLKISEKHTIFLT